ncbi:MAG: S-layer homology domain-containing protein [Eubacteriales bacterium]|nr:S-layer homology domain-containing protein [Eubacteriales bacterium]
MKRIIAAMVAATTLFTTAYADNTADLVDKYINHINAPWTFSDMSGITWAAPSVDFLVSKGIVKGFEDGTFRPDNNITKAEFVKIVISSFGIFNPKAAVRLIDNTDTDWYFPYVSTALEYNIATIDENGYFNPNEYITREEMFEISKRAISFAEISLTNKGTSITFTDEDAINPDYKASIDYMSANGIVAGNPDGTLRPKANSTRAESCVMLKRMIDSVIENEKAVYNEVTAAPSEEAEGI